MDHFADKVAIVTGGASGLGRAVCMELGRRGATVFVADTNSAAADAVAATIAAAGGRARAAHLNVSRVEDVEQLVADAVKAGGRLDFMFNNAGVGIGGDYRDMTLEHWREIIDVNLWGVIYGTTAAYRVMVGQGFGHIVNTASLAGLVAVPTETAYATTKHAVVGLSTSLRGEAAGLGVKVSVVCPGLVRTPIFDTATVLNVDRQAMLAALPRKMMEPTRAARVILKGVARNREKIVFPFPYRFLWWLYRLSPRLVSRFSRRLVDDLRRLRRVS